MPLVESTERWPCPRGFIQHVRVRKYVYPPREEGGRPITTIICPDCKSVVDAAKRADRRNGTRRNNHKLGKRTAAHVAIRHAQVASMLGAGQTYDQVANATGYAESAIVGIKKSIHKDSFLRQQMDDARVAFAHRLLPKALEVTERIIDRANERINSYRDTVGFDKEGRPLTADRTPGPKDLAPILREMAAVAGLTRGGMNQADIPMQQNNVTINFNNPEVSRAALLALAGWQKKLTDAKQLVASIPDAIDAEVVDERTEEGQSKVV